MRMSKRRFENRMKKRTPKKTKKLLLRMRQPRLKPRQKMKLLTSEGVARKKRDGSTTLEDLIRGKGGAVLAKGELPLKDGKLVIKKS